MQNNNWQSRTHYLGAYVDHSRQRGDGSTETIRDFGNNRYERVNANTGERTPMSVNDALTELGSTKR